MRVSSTASRGDRFYFAVDTPTGVNVLRDSYTTLPDATRVLGRVLTSAVNTSGGIAGFETPESLGASAHQYFVLDST